jgi:3-phosphoshikimate 1-carboxyvinyltransferase
VLPGDKSITQRAILIGALAPGTTRIRNGNPGADAAASLGIARALGVRVRRERDGALVILGGTLRESDRVLDARNSGTALRLATGLLAAQPFQSVLTGDASLRRRPVDRVLRPLAAFGADLSAREAGRLPPVVVRGRGLRGAAVSTGVASAQVKSALLLAAIQADGPSEIREATPTRDHTERMLPLFGAAVRVDAGGVRVEGSATLHGADVDVPGDPSAAAFLAAAAALVPRSDLRLRGVGVNPTRCAFFDLLVRAGATVTFEEERPAGAEPVADLRVRAGTIRPITVGPGEIAGLIDELPLVAVLAAFARGTSEITGAAELRLKESDRIESVASALRAVGGSVEVLPDGWRIEGVGALEGGDVATQGDHRIAMAFLVAGLRAKRGVRVDDAASVEVSDPGFLARLRGLTR